VSLHFSQEVKLCEVLTLDGTEDGTDEGFNADASDGAIDFTADGTEDFTLDGTVDFTLDGTVDFTLDGTVDSEDGTGEGFNEEAVEGSTEVFTLGKAMGSRGPAEAVKLGH